ncbi:peptidase [Nocardioides sp. HDW12B]|uniref:trypsin-like serine peptidase n=1 Tax=Nocardioides sp. HDW12B TaxID=2714939 RepID=UPI001407F9F1|nr:peptidase [Nocardioides sp. HDW12B]QIK65956.1 peptidase [Nocardioides sp. HDW12B]
MRNLKRPTALAGVTGMLLAGLLAAGNGTAEAAPERDSRAAVVGHRTAAASDAAAAERIRDYWTPKRMRAADPLVVSPSTSSDTTVERGTPQTVRGQVAKGKPGGGSSSGYLGGPWTGGGNVVKTTGKVFFTLGGSNYVCSGSAVTSPNKSTVTTAGHCLNEGPGDYASNFSFVPAYDNGSAPYGEWVATQLFTTTEWATTGDYNYDVGMAKVGTLNGATLTETVGSQGIGFNQARGQFVHAFGYPAASPYDGQELDYCSGTTTNDTRGTQDMRLACNMTGGSSGGPWFQQFSGGNGVQVSVNSFGYRGEKNAMYGPYFGSVIQTLYTTASAS